MGKRRVVATTAHSVYAKIALSLTSGREFSDPSFARFKFGNDNASISVKKDLALRLIDKVVPILMDDTSIAVDVSAQSVERR